MAYDLHARLSLGALTLSIRIARVRAMPVIKILQLKRQMRDNFCVFLSGALMRRGIGSEMRYRSVKMLQERNTDIKTGDTAGRQINPGLGNICHIIFNGRQVTNTETTVPAQVKKSNAALSHARTLAPRMPSCRHQ